MAPTWLGMAGMTAPAGMDGRSIVPLIIDPRAAGVPSQTLAHIAAVAPRGTAAYAAGWRDHVFVEYYFNDPNTKCGDYPTEDRHNNFIGIRHMAGSAFGDTSYTEYQSGNQGDAK